MLESLVDAFLRCLQQKVPNRQQPYRGTRLSKPAYPVLASVTSDKREDRSASHPPQLSRRLVSYGDFSTGFNPRYLLQHDRGAKQPLEGIDFQKEGGLSCIVPIDDLNPSGCCDPTSGFPTPHWLKSSQGRLATKLSTWSTMTTSFEKRSVIFLKDAASRFGHSHLRDSSSTSQGQMYPHA